MVSIQHNMLICHLEYEGILQYTVEGKYTLEEGLFLGITVLPTSSKLLMYQLNVYLTYHHVL